MCPRAARLRSQDDVTRRVHRLSLLTLEGKASLLDEEHGLLLYWLLFCGAVSQELEPILSINDLSGWSGSNSSAFCLQTAVCSDSLRLQGLQSQ